MGATRVTLRRHGERKAVSIHAPGWARHSVPNAATCGSSVSIHAPGWARPWVLTPLVPKICFNSRARVGATGRNGRWDARRSVSIHAPGWARLAGDLARRTGRTVFQFTRPGGRDVSCVSVSCVLPVFQFTRPGGRDRDNGAIGVNSRRFNSRARVGATRTNSSAISSTVGFNSRARVGATGRRRRTSGLKRFQFTRPGGRDRGRRRRTSGLKRFQFTRPGGRDSREWPKRHCGRCFNSRARVGATQGRRARGPHRRVSIHAPGWARHARRTDMAELICVSIHAPGWARRPDSPSPPSPSRFQFTRPGGRDNPPTTTSAPSPSFNSRARVGATSDFRPPPPPAKIVSIHAPGWARHLLRDAGLQFRQFQFTRPGGRDMSEWLVAVVGILFQFTRPGGRDLWPRLPLPLSPCFNSRARVGATNRG